MQKKEERLIKTEVVTEIICDCCKKSIDPDKNDFIHIEKEWGYFSHKDGEKQEVDLCENCWDKITETFKISV